MDAQWPYLFEDNIHAKRQNIEWFPIIHSIVDSRKKILSAVNSIIYDKSNLGQNITVHNSIIGNRVTLGDNCCVKSVDFSSEVKKM